MSHEVCYSSGGALRHGCLESVYIEKLSANEQLTCCWVLLRYDILHEGFVIIRKAQLEPAAKAAAAAFEQEMVDHLFSFSPKHCEVIKEPGVREVIRLGLQRAEAFGFTFRGPVRLFIELMFMFGSEFATDPQHPWAAAALQDKTVPDQMSRASLLYDAAQKYLEEVSGPNHRYAVASLRRTRAQINQASGRKLDMPPRELDHAITS